MKKATMMNAKMNQSRSAQVSCAASACSENNSIIIILDAIMASIFALIGLLNIRLISLFSFRNMTSCQAAPHF